VGLATAAVFVWIGMVVAISFIEAPLKFRAPDVTVRIGLGIGRLVFRALNIAECFLAAAVIAGLILGEPSAAASVSAAVAIAALVVQIIAVRPALTRRSDRVLAGDDAGTRSHAHVVYIGFEVVKLIALLVAGVLLVS
jgi:hypothetical protein